MQPKDIYHALNDTPDTDAEPEGYSPYDMRKYDTVGIMILYAIGLVTFLIGGHEFFRYAARVWGWYW